MLTVLRESLMTAAGYGLLAIFLAPCAGARCQEDAFSRWATAHAVALATVEPVSDLSDLLPLKRVVGTSRVVALGEATHGAHEPLALRNRLLRFLVEQMGFTAIALESGFTESSITQAFIAGGPDPLQRVLRDGLSGERGRYRENRELIQWMRDYNVAAPTAGHRSIRFYGIDLPAGNRMSGASLAIEYALDYLAGAAPSLANRIRLSLGESLPRNDWRWDVLPRPALAALERTIPEIANAMATNRDSLIAHSSAAEYRWALQNLEVASQLARCQRVTTPTSLENMKYAGPVIGCRDEAMAQNVRWVVENEGPQGRVLVFAHNNHVMNWSEDGGYWAGMQEKPAMMGAHLRRAFGDGLLIVATSSAMASAPLPTPEPLEDSIDDALACIGRTNMFLDLRPAREDEAARAWLSSQRPLHANISTHVLITPATAVDGLLFLRGLTPAILYSAQTPEQPTPAGEARGAVAQTFVGGEQKQ
ncbi:MAG: erythromycin esterase family protein [Gammaproteobacteria bacterium]|nr:erythromycin esterase family protein [Gammaproteobacteria bacterium]